MEHTHRDRFTTGEFAALCGVTRHTLFHYDALGIFSPAVRGENGYRYYTAAQLDVFQVISVLRELDLSLGEIRAYLDRRSPEALAELLEREDARLGEKIARLSDALNALEDDTVSVPLKNDYLKAVIKRIDYYRPAAVRKRSDSSEPKVRGGWYTPPFELDVRLKI